MDKNQKTVKDFYDFLEQHRVIKRVGEPLCFTHTSLGNPQGSFNINVEDRQQFIRLYKKAIKAGAILHLTEKHFEQAPILVDIDFKYKATTNERKYTIDHIKRVVESYNYCIKEFIDIKDSTKLNAYISEKGNPTFVSSSDDGMNIYKDGFHIVYPNICTKPKLQYILRDCVICDVRKHKYFEDINPINELSDIFDKAVIERNGWMMYGSCKPNCYRYELTKVLDENTVEVDIDEEELFSLVEDLSIHKFTTNDIDPYNSTFTEEKIQKIYDDLYPRTKNSKVISEKDLGLVYQLVNMLDKKRYENYGEWIELGFCLHNIDNNLLELWIEFSKRSKKFKDGECEKIWSNLRDDGLTIKSLHRWAKQDNPGVYSEFILAELSDVMKKSISGTSYDVAKAFYEMNKYSFTVSSISHKTWFYFNDSKWSEMDCGYRIINLLNEDMVNKYITLATTYGIKASTVSGDDKDKLLKEQKKCNEVSLKLRTSSFKKTILEELLTLYYDPSFVDKLDEARHLICFNNGVLDMNTMLFREGRPEDYISLCTNIDYMPYDASNPIVQEVNNFLTSIQPEPDMRSYVVKFLSSCLAGHTPDEKIHIWTGSGCHAKNTLIMMSDGKTKKVQDIKIGDKLMGPDGKARNVLNLYHGRDMLYKIKNKENNESYIVNSEHKLALRYIGNRVIKYKNGYRIIWVKYDRNNKLRILNKYINVIKYKDNTKKYAELYLSRLEQNSNIIVENQIISIKVRDYIKLSNNLKKLLTAYKGVSRFNHVDIYDENIDEIAEKYIDEIPDNYKYNSIEIQNRVLKSYINKYGLIYKSKIELLIDINEEKLANDIIFIARSIGYNINKFIINGKYNLTINILKNWSSKIIAEKMTMDEYFGFELDNDHSYLLADHTATFNSNGKSVLINLMMLSIGDYSTTLSISLLTQKRAASNAATPELADTKGRRFAVFQEPDNNDHINVGFMKELTGNDKIKTRKLYREPFEFYPQFKPVLTCNRLPVIPSNDGGTWRRIRVTPFEMKFVDNPVEDYERQIDRKLKDRLPLWREAFVSILVNEYNTYKVEGLQEPAKVLQFTKRYELESDTFQRFLNTIIAKSTDKDQINLGDLHREYSTWYKCMKSDKCTATRDDVKYQTEEKLKKRFNGEIMKGYKFIATIGPDGVVISKEGKKIEIEIDENIIEN